MKTKEFINKVSGKVFFVVRRLGLLDKIPDDVYLKMLWRRKFKTPLNLDNPQTFNEKLQWLKLYDRKPEYTQMVDKYEAKKYMADRIGERYIISTLDVWERFEDIVFDTLPDRFVLKCTHDSGGLVICRDKSKLDIAKAQKKINRSLKKNYFWAGREWPYKNVKPRIIAEEYIEDADSKDGTLTDYKVFCFAGQPKVILTVKGGHGNEIKTVRRMYDPDWTLYEVGLHGKAFVNEPEERPETLDEMLRLAAKLSDGHRHLRVDFYDVGGKLYVGELTFYHMSGMEIFEPASFDCDLGEFLQLT